MAAALAGLSALAGSFLTLLAPTAYKHTSPLVGAPLLVLEAVFSQED